MPTLRTATAKGSELSVAEGEDWIERNPVSKSSNYTLAASDNRAFHECSNGITVTFPDIATLLAACETGDFWITLINTGSSDVTIALTTGSDTIDGYAGSVKLPPNASKMLYIDTSGTGVRNAWSSNASPQRNLLINGDFDHWQYSTSQTTHGTDGYGSDDRWSNQVSGATRTHSQQAFTVGQTDVPDNPTYFSRTDITVAGTGVADYVLKAHYIESVQTLAGQTATLSFYAKADAARDIAVEFIQDFGSGGSPSSTVTGIGVTTVSLTTSWTKYTITVSLPSISGKTIGTNGDDALIIGFWFDAGSNFDARTNTLGHQTGTFDLSHVKLEPGSVATAFTRAGVSITDELALCKQYHIEDMQLGGSGYATAGGQTARALATVAYDMRGTPSVTYTNLAGSNNDGSLTVQNVDKHSLLCSEGSSAAGALYWLGYVTLHAELK